LVSPCERIRINGEPISEDEFTATFWECHDILAAKNNGKIPHYFRMIFFMFLKISRQRNIDVAIVEVGIGGRYDSTNFIMPQVCGITTVDLDHQNLLGNNLQAIAWHKSGIMKVREETNKG
jgi:folylpolyglutamate synthase